MSRHPQWDGEWNFGQVLLIIAVCAALTLGVRELKRRWFLPAAPPPVVAQPQGGVANR